MGNKNKVLLVEENNINRRIMTSLLKSLNTEVVEAKDGFEAFEKVKNNDFSLVLMDIFMHAPDGFETAKKLREIIGKDVSIIAVTASDTDTIKDKVLEYGMNGVLSKPLKKKQLEIILTKCLAHNELPVFNQRDFEKQFDDASLRKEIVKTFLEENDADMENLLTAFKTKDCTEIHKVVHYLKGTFSYLRADRVLKLSQTILDYTRKNMIEEILDLEQSFINNYNVLVKRLKDYK